MKLVVALLLLLSSFSAASLISFDKVDTLFTKLMLNQLTEQDNSLLQDAFAILRRPEYISVTPLDQSSKLRTNTECHICRSAVAAIVAGIHCGQTDEQIIVVVTTICFSLGVATYKVCKGAVSLNVPIIARIIRTTPKDTPHPEVLCGLVLQTADDPNACPYDDPRFDWQVKLPEKSSAQIKVPDDEHKPLKIAIITDAHIDPLYEAYGVADCDEPTCCRKGQKQSVTYQTHNTDSLLKKSLVDAGGKPKLDLSGAQKIRELNKLAKSNAQISQSKPAGYWGDYRNCDSPTWAFEDVIKHINETHQGGKTKNVSDRRYLTPELKARAIIMRSEAFFITARDTIHHGIWETSYELLLKMHRYIADKIRETFGDAIQIVPVIGNHESQPCNQFAPDSIIDPGFNTTWLYRVLADKWSHYLPEEAQATLRKRGNFVLSVRPGFRVISLNNIVAYKFNWWLNYNPRDSKLHLVWLAQELYKAELDGVKVHILTHIPPGSNDLMYTWTREYNRIVNRFSSTITAEFNGHTHEDTFKIFYSLEDGRPINMAWGGGGIVTYSYYNLNYKIVETDPKTYTTANIYNYIYNLTEANLTPNRRPSWYLLYDMKNTFGISDLTPNTINNLVRSMGTTQRHLLDLYVSYSFKLSDKLWPECDDVCKFNTLCGTVTTVLWERQRCDEFRNLLLT